MLDTHSKIIAMSFQGKDFTPAMKQLVINLNTFAKMCELERASSAKRL